MRPLFAVAVCAVALLGLTPAPDVKGSGHIRRERRKVGEFTSLSLSGEGEVSITQTGTCSLTVETDDNLLSHITSEVSDGELQVGPDDPIAPTKRIRYTITVKDLASLDIGAAISGELVKLNAESLSIRNPGAGSLEAKNLHVGTLSVESLGAGTLYLHGSARNETVVVHGDGFADCRNVDAGVVSVDVSARGRAFVQTNETLTVKASGSGSVEYTGHPRVTQSITGAGRVLAH